MDCARRAAACAAEGTAARVRRQAGVDAGPQPPGNRAKREQALIQNFDYNVAGKLEQFCASLAEDGTRRVFISFADTAKTLVILDATGLLGALKAELEEPDQLIAHAIRKAQNEGLIERAISSGAIQETSL
jgi:hypothetical protein